MIGDVAEECVVRDRVQPHISTTLLLGDLNFRHPRDAPMVLGQTAPDHGILNAPAAAGAHIG